MIRIIDATLVYLDEYRPSARQLAAFCCLLREIGIDDMELSKRAYDELKPLPEGIRFYLLLEKRDKQSDYPGIYKFIYRNGAAEENSITELQVNDIREVVKFRMYADCAHIRITGLDDLLCHNYAQVIKDIKQYLSKSKVNFQPEDFYKCSSGLAVTWIANGGREVTTAFNGIGSKAKTEEVIMALRLAVRHKPNQKLNQFPELCRLFEEITGSHILNHKPVIGKHIFFIESGIHVDGILKNPSNYEPYPPDVVGQKTKIVIGKYSGINSIRKKLDEQKISIVDEKKIKLLLKEVRRQSVEKRGSLSDKEFIGLAKEVISGEGNKIYS